MHRETLEMFVRQLLSDVPLPPEDWALVVPEVERMMAVVAGLDELPLDTVEPAAIYKVVP